MAQAAEASALVAQIEADASAHVFLAREAQDSLDLFRSTFLPLYPFLHLPLSLNSCDLRRDKPFTWLVIMALTSTNVARQFAIEATIWQIISQRIVVQHYANIDLLLGTMAFSAW
jgi:hypothetical protein